MKKILTAILLLAILSCQKEIKLSNDSVITEVQTVSSDLSVLPCHSVSFTTAYPIRAGEVPHFRFTKALYSDGRVKSLNMLTRVFPIYAGQKKWAYEWTGTFSYQPNQATFTGTRQTWEYYKTSTGAAAKRSIRKLNILRVFGFNKRGYCTKVTDGQNVLLEVMYEYDPAYNPQPAHPDAIINIFTLGDENSNGSALHYPVRDQYGNLLSFTYPYNRFNSTVQYTYDYSKPKGSKRFSFIPSQNLISQEYSFCESMQWIPDPTFQRASVTGIFYTAFSDNSRVAQKQYYKNFVFDAKGNETKVTYADNVNQLTSWQCK